MATLKETKATLAAANKDVLTLIRSFADEQSFIETDAFMSSETDIADAPGEGVVSGFASVGGKGVCVFAINPKVLKGSIGALNAKKITRCINNAVRTEKPLIAVWDTSGARFAEGIDALDGYGDILRAYTLAYGDIPVISIIKGNNLGISSYVAGLSDFVIAYDESVMATSSPLVISAQTGVDVKNVGSAKTLAENGIVTNIVKKDLRDTLIKILSVFAGGAESGDDANRVCKGLKCGADMKAVIKEVFDKNSFLPVRDGFAQSVITGFATLGDIPVGVVATNAECGEGKLTAQSCLKITEFLGACSTADCPVVFLVDSAGTEVCADDTRLMYELSNLLYAVHTQQTDMFAVVCGKAIGGAYTTLVAPCEYKIAWECAEVGALASESAARLLYADEIKSAKNKDKAAEKLATAYAAENCSALTLARSGHFDNVIEPNLTRSYLLAALVAHME